VGLDVQQQVLGRTPAEAFGDESAMRHEAAFRRVMSGSSAAYEWQMSLGDAKRHLQTTMSPLRDEDGGVIGAVGVARDITEQMILDEAFSQTNVLLHAVVGSSPVAIFTLDEHGRIRSSAAPNRFSERARPSLGELLVRPAESEEVARMIRSARSRLVVHGQEVRAGATTAWIAPSICAAPLAGSRGVAASRPTLARSARGRGAERDRRSSRCRPLRSNRPRTRSPSPIPTARSAG
jgi:hypothetical protein